MVRRWLQARESGRCSCVTPRRARRSQRCPAPGIAGTGELLHTLEGHEEAVTCLAFSPDGKMLATGSPDRTVRLWDVAKGKELRTLEGHTSWAYAVAFSRDGKTLA